MIYCVLRCWKGSENLKQTGTGVCVPNLRLSINSEIVSEIRLFILTVGPTDGHHYNIHYRVGDTSSFLLHKLCTHKHKIPF